MSINVTVSGNPVSIKRGKMVTCDPNHAKKEFAKRRLMRLEQVRQQSKDIAEDVRNKVRKEKKKQMGQIEKEGEEKLKNWQNRKLLELQTQYREALRELGTGHKKAAELEGEDEVLAEQREYNKGIAKHHSQVAATQIQLEKERKQMKKTIPIQQRKVARDIENTRSSLVSNIKKKKNGASGSIGKITKKRKASADINITLPESNSESREDEDEDTEYIEEEEKSSCECTEDSQEHPWEPLDINTNLDSKCPYQEISDVSPEPDMGRSSKIPDEITKFTENIRQETTGGCKQPPKDTRISDRIKRRDIMASQPDYCDIAAEIHPTPLVASNTRIRDAIDSRYFGKPDSGTGLKDGRYSTEDIPTKPPVKLKDTDGQQLRDTYDSQKMEYYDHPNRFSQEKVVPSSSLVEKITTDSLEVMPNITTETELKEKMKRRDREAHIRGQRALEKERIQRDYEDMMKKLPLLQKKERICEINRDKQKYHMSEGRLKEKERERQNKLDNAYSKLFPSFKPAIVTLPTRSRDKQEKEVKAFPDDESVQSLNVGRWDVDHEQKMFTAEEVREIIRVFTEQQKPKDRQAKLKELLRSLRLQKEQLLDEIKSLPQDDSINQLINDLNSFSDSDENKKTSKREQERKRRLEENEKETSSDSTTESSSSREKKKNKAKDKPSTRQQSQSAKVPSPRKKAKIKSRRKVLILQNTSTQTTPKITSSSEEKSVDQTKQYPLCSKLHVPCDCNKENESTEELCQILIKLNDKEEPKIVVKSKEKDGKVVEEDRKSEQATSIDKEIKSISVGVGTYEIGTEPSRDTVKTKKVSSKVVRTVSTAGSKKTVSRESSIRETRTDKIEAKKDTFSRTDGSETKSKSWKEQLSKISVSTSSTSYFSPPDFQKSDDMQFSSASSDSVSKQSFYNLRKKPQQENLNDIPAAISLSQSQASSGVRTIEPRLLKYIKKLLGKSRESIENLTVSSSSVQTPSQSIVEMDTNNPLYQLHNIIKYFNLKTEDIMKDLSYSSDHTTLHYNTSVSSSERSLQGQEKSTSSKKETSLNSVISKDSISEQYADITDSCSRRIAALAAMISQIREEKIQMLNNGLVGENAGSDRDYSTAYLDLPKSKDSSSGSEGKHSSLNSLDDEELHRRLTEVDMSLARKLRKFSPVRAETIDEDKHAEAEEISKDTVDDINVDKEIQIRLERLLKETVKPPFSSTRIERPEEDNTPFVPFLSDIPKLPKLEMQTATDTNSHRRPPPSKGLTVAKKFNGNISLMPHELSTIIEADSQLSTKVGSAQVSPNASKTSHTSSPRKGLQLLVRTEDETGGTQTSYHSTSSKFNENPPGTVTKVSITSKKSPDRQVDAEKSKSSSADKTISPLNLSYDITSKSIISDKSGSTSTLSAQKSVHFSSSSSDDMQSIEAMLKSIGMEWAISTLHKTQEALALTSSSSSLDIDTKRKAKGNESGGSEVSLRDYLRKQLISKVSSSTMKTDASPASLLSEFSDLSSILVSSKEKQDRKRTSTPLTRSTNKSDSSEKRVIFSGGSEISSVKDESQKHSDKHSYCSCVSDDWNSKSDQ